jgi:beta-lactamase class C
MAQNDEERDPDSNRISRRELLKKGVAAGLSLGVVSTFPLQVRRSRAEESSAQASGGDKTQIVREGPITELIRKHMQNTQTPGIAVGLYDGNHQPSRQIFPEGYANIESRRPVSPELIFEIGSVTKVFTSTLLGYRPEILNEPLAEHLPIKARNPELRRIKVVNLATHTSGFPPNVEGPGRDGGPYLFHDRLPPEDSAIVKLWNNWAPTHPRNGYCRTCDVGTCWNYSNVGFVTLGFVVGGDHYNQALKEKITGPLSMAATSANPPEGSPLADGYIFKNGERHRATGRDFDLNASALDMINWIKAQVEPSEVQDQALGAAIVQTHQKHFIASNQCSQDQPIHFDMGLGWQIHPFLETGLTIAIKDGGTFLGGQSCWVGFIESKKLGVAVLTNMIGGKSSPAELGLQILHQRLKNGE